MVDPRLHGVLVVIDRDGETADPHLEAVAIALGLAYRACTGRMRLTPQGKKEIAGEKS